MNWLLFIMVAAAYLGASYKQLLWVATTDETAIAPMQAMNTAMLDAATNAVTLAIGLIGIMMLFLGLMKILEQGGFLVVIAKLLHPILKPLFPEIPPHHPAMGAMIMNLSANVLGLGNAATPFGIRAMQELNHLNPLKGTATNAMILFMVINTTCVTVLPTKIIAMRLAAGSSDPAGVIPTILTASLIATILAILVTKLMQRFFPFPNTEIRHELQTNSIQSNDNPSEIIHGYPLWMSILAILGLIAVVPLTIIYGKSFSPWVIPTLLVVIFAYGMSKKIKIYECFVEGAKEGFEIAVRIMPYLVTILVAVAMLRSSGGLDFMTTHLSKITAPFGLPAEALPMALLRPLSGSGAFGILTSIINDPSIGPDSYVGYLVSTLMGTTETSFYILAVYFGAVQIKKFRHAVLAAILADIGGVIAAVMIVKWLYGAPS